MFNIQVEIFCTNKLYADKLNQKTKYNKQLYKKLRKLIERLRKIIHQKLYTSLSYNLLSQRMQDTKKEKNN